MLGKVLKKMKQLEKKSDNTSNTKKNSYVQSPLSRGGVGFHAKANSLQGAARQRSIGNRNTKPSR